MKPEIQKALLAACGRYVRKLLDPVDARLKALESRIVQKGDPGRDGVDGKDGRDGRDGTSVSVADLEPVLSGMVRSAVAELPYPVNGRDGADGRDGVDGKDGQSPDADAVASAVAAQFERRFADLSLSWERQVRDIAEKAIDRIPPPKDGADGRDGRDGIGWDDMRVEHDGRRCVTLVWTKGDEEHRAEIVIPAQIDAGFWQAGAVYEKGDGVTFGGSYWIAQADTASKPEVGNADWRLAVKKGRDAKTREVAI